MGLFALIDTVQDQSIAPPDPSWTPADRHVPGEPGRARGQQARTDDASSTPVEVSLVIPACNEEARLPDTVRRYADALRARYGEHIEIVVVANGCTDRTAEVATGLQDHQPGLRVIDVPEPIGKGGAVLRGLQEARGASRVFADADGATEPASLIELIDGLAEADVVIGTRRDPRSVVHRRQPLRRRVLSRLFNVAVRWLFNLSFRDTQCGAKAFRAEAAEQLAGAVRERRWTFDVDLLLTARRLGLRVVERPVVWGDVDGSTLKTGETAVEVVRSLLGLWRREQAATVGTWARPSPDAIEAEPRQRILALNWRCPRHPDAGGAELNLFEQARRWARDGHAVTVVAARRAGSIELPAVEQMDGVTVRRMGGRFSVYLLAAWYLLWHEHEYDRVLDVANGTPFFAHLFTTRPVTLLVHHVHDLQWFEEFPRPLATIGWALERYVVPVLYRRTPTIAVSPTTRDALMDTGFRPEQLHVIYNGVSTPPAQTRESAHPLIAYVGRVKRYKRLDRLVRAAAALRHRFPGLRLVIAGDGDARPELETMVRDLKLEDLVQFTGFVDEQTKAKILGSAHVFATPSMHEGWGLSVIEANQHGTPAVAYDVPGLRVAIRDGETGLLAADDDEFRENLATLLGDAETRGRFAAAARRWAARFDWDTTADETFKILRAGHRRTEPTRSPQAA